jgi:hypothetical protein
MLWLPSFVGLTKSVAPNDDLSSLVLGRSLDDGETDAASTKDSNVGALLDSALSGSDDGGSVTGGDTAAEQASAVHGCLRGDGDDRDVCYDSVLRECGCTHEMEEVFALALETRSAVGHNTLALSCANLAAQVGLARLAELALLAFWCTRGCQSQKWWLREFERTRAQQRGRRALHL